MANQIIRQRLSMPWNWVRIGGLSGSVAVHMYAILLLALPIVMPAPKPSPPVVSTRLIESPPDPVEMEIPPPPQLLKRPQRQKITVARAKPVAREASVMAIPLSAPLADIDLPPLTDAVIPEAPTSLANVSLAYESIIEPRYPMDSRKRGEQGTVVLRVRVGRDGLPTQIEVARSSGFRPLDRAARDAVLRWRFRPVQINGISVEASGLVPIKFGLGQG